MWGLIVKCLFCFAVAFCPFKFWFHLAGEERELGTLVCSEFSVASVLWISLVVPWVGLSYVVVTFPGHTHLPVGFPVASQAKYFCELAIRFYDEPDTLVDLKRFIPVHELFHKTTEQQHLMMFFYRLTGCDTCIAFWNRKEVST